MTETPLAKKRKNRRKDENRKSREPAAPPPPAAVSSSRTRLKAALAWAALLLTLTLALGILESVKEALLKR